METRKKENKHIERKSMKGGCEQKRLGRTQGRH